MHPQDRFVRYEYGADRLSAEQAHGLPRLPIFGVLDCIRSAHNVGSMFRTADGAGVAELLLCGYTATPPHRHLAKTALGAVDVVPWSHHATAAAAIAALRGRGVQILAAEYTATSVPLESCDLRFPVAIVMGNELEGLSDATMAACDATVHLPMHGLKNSLNVSVAFGIVVYELLRRCDVERGAAGGYPAS